MVTGRWIYGVHLDAEAGQPWTAWCDTSEGRGRGRRGVTCRRDAAQILQSLSATVRLSLTMRGRDGKESDAVVHIWSACCSPSAPIFATSVTDGRGGDTHGSTEPNITNISHTNKPFRGKCPFEKVERRYGRSRRRRRHFY